MADRRFGIYSDRAPRSIERDMHGDLTDKDRKLPPSDLTLDTTDVLVLRGQQIATHTKTLHNLNETILRKRKKSKSKKLEDSEREYDVTYEKLMEALTGLITLLRLKTSEIRTTGTYDTCMDCDVQRLKISKLERKLDLQSCVDVEQNVIDLENKVFVLLKEIDNLKSQLSEVSASKDVSDRRVFGHLKEIDDLKSQLSEVSASRDVSDKRVFGHLKEIDDLKSQLSEVSASKDVSDKRVFGHLKEIDDLKSQLSEVSASKDVSDKRVFGHLKEIDDLKSQLSEVSASKDVSDKRVFGHLKEIDDLKSQLSEVSASKDVSDKRVFVLLKEIDDLKSQLSEVSASKDVSDKRVFGHLKEIDDLKSQLSEVSASKDVSDKRVFGHLKEIDDLKSQLSEVSASKDVSDKRVFGLLKEIDDLKSQLSEVSASKDVSDKRVFGLLKEINDLKSQLSEVSASKDVSDKRVRDLQQKVNDMEKEINEVSSAKFKNDIRISFDELSDKNRPTKLAEQLSELYNNEWTDVFDEMKLNSTCSDTKLIKCLLDAFMDIFNECRWITTHRFFERVQMCIEHSDKIKMTQYTGSIKIPDPLRHQILEFRKSRAAATIKDVIEDSSLLLSAEAPEKFDSVLFREYEKSGRYTAFVVWPILFLHDGGPILCKGVAQGSDYPDPRRRWNHLTKLRRDTNIDISYNERTPFRDIEKQADDLSRAENEVLELKQEVKRLNIKVTKESTLKAEAITSELQKQVKHLEKQNMEESSAKFEANTRIDELEERVHSLKIQLCEESSAKEEANKGISELQKQVKRLEKQNMEESSAKFEANTRRRELQRKVDSFEQQAKKESASREMAMMSNKLPSDKLRHNNTSIAEISDNNRPTKLAEKVSELYDNEWTDAFDEMDNISFYSERELIDCLLHAFMDIFAECRRITTDRFFERVQRCIEHSNELEMKQYSGFVELPTQLRQQILEFRKLRASATIEHVVDDLLKRSRFDYFQKPPYNSEKARAYLEKCVELSWIMCVQDPPLVLSVQAPKEFNTALFREYTKRGRYTAYVVWPILYLHDGGPILCKGVAQGSNYYPLEYGV